MANTFLDRLRDQHTLRFLLITAIITILLSEWAKFNWGLVLLDGISDPETLRSVLTSLSKDQITGHIWFTATIDVILPLLAGGLFASAALHSFGRFGTYLAIPPLLAIPIDLSEGVIQILALTGTPDLLSIKAITTPIKGGGYLFGLIVSIVGLLRWIVRQVAAFTKNTS